MLDLRNIKTSASAQATLVENHFFKNVIFLIIKYFFRISTFLIDFFHKYLDKILAFLLYSIIKTVWSWLFYVETFLYSYLKRSKYIKNDQFEQKIEEDKLIMLWMGLKDTKRITLREISNELWVSEFYARKIKDIAKNWSNYYWEYTRIMKYWTSDSEKKDKRSTINNSKDYD